MSFSIEIMMAIFIAFLALIMLHTSWKINRSVLFLSFYLFINAFTIIFYDIIVKGGSSEVFLMMLGTSKPLFLLSGPLLYFFIRGVLDENYRFSGKELIHLIPFFLCFVSLIPYFLSPLHDKLEYVHKIIGNLPCYLESTLYILPNWASILICSIHAIVYVFAALFIIYNANNKKKNILRGAYQKQHRKNYFWFLFVALIALILNVFHMGLSLCFVFERMLLSINCLVFSPFYFVVYFIFTLAIPLMCLLNPGFLYAYPAMTRLNPLVKKENFKLSENKNYTVLEHLDRSLTYNNYFTKLSEKLFNYVTENQLYVELDFDIQELSQSLCVPMQHIHFCAKYFYGSTCEEMIDLMRINYFLDKFDFYDDQIDTEDLVRESGFNHYKDFLKKFKRHQGISFDDWYASNI